MNPRCELPGCKLEMDEQLTRCLDSDGNAEVAYVCPASHREHELSAKLAESEAKVKELEAKLADKEQHLSRAYDELRDHRDPVGAYARRQIAAGKTCHTCVHFISRCESPNSDRVNCKIAEGWPHWTGCCKHEAIPEEARKKGAEHGE